VNAAYDDHLLPTDGSTVNAAYDDHLLPTVKLFTAGASENGNRATVLYIVSKVEKLETRTVIVIAGVDFQLE